MAVPNGDLDDSVARVYRAWYAADIGVINPAIQGLNEDESVEFTTPTGHFSKAAKCRHLIIPAAVSRRRKSNCVSSFHRRHRRVWTRTPIAFVH